MDVVSFFLTSLSLIFDLLQLKYNGSNMYQQHPNLAGIAEISLIIYCCLLWIELRYSVHYQNYLGSVPFVVNFLGCLSVATTISLLLQGYPTPLVFILLLIIPVMKALHWIFTRMDEEFGDTEFWRRRVEPVLRYLRRRVNSARRNNILPR